MDLWVEASEARLAAFKLRNLHDFPSLKSHKPLYDGGYDKIVSRGHANAMVQAGIRTMDNNCLRFKYFPGDCWIDWEYWKEPVSRKSVHSEKLRLNRANRRHLRQCIQKEQEDFEFVHEERIESELIFMRSYFHRRNKHQTKHTSQ